MTASLIHKMKKIFYLGTEEANLPHLNQKILLTNAIAAIFIVLNIPFTILSAYYFPSLYFCQIAFFTAAFAVFLLNYYHFALLARLLICAVNPTISLIYNAYLLPNDSGFVLPIYMLQMALWIPTILVFDRQEKKQIALLTIYHLCLLASLPFLNSLLEVQANIKLSQKRNIDDIFLITTLIGILITLLIINYLNIKLNKKNGILISILTKQNTHSEEKQQEIESQNEELKQQQEELKTANEQLKDQHSEVIKQKKMIEAQKMRAEVLVKSLESQVSKQTYKLQNMLDNVTKQNEDLKQFSYIISHNIRSPIAHLLGLVSIFNRENMNDPFNQEVLNLLDSSANNLDMVIRDLTKIIAIRNNLNKEKEKIDIIKLIELEKKLLQDEIANAKAIIIEELTDESIVFAIRSYVQSIIHNLLANAIKYKDSRRQLQITIKTQISTQFLCISVQDNGLGIELNENTREKLFGLYQRMHDHVKGKGLGLYMVKTQVEALGGRVEVESTLEKGSIFKVYLPINR